MTQRVPEPAETDIAHTRVAHARDALALWALQQAALLPSTGEPSRDGTAEAALYEAGPYETGLYPAVCDALRREPLPPEPAWLAERVVAEARRRREAEAEIAEFGRHLWALLACFCLALLFASLAWTGTAADLSALGQRASAEEALLPWLTVVGMLAVLSMAVDAALRLRRESRPF